MEIKRAHETIKKTDEFDPDSVRLLLKTLVKTDPTVYFRLGKVHFKRKIRVDGVVPNLPERLIPDSVLHLRERYQKGEKLHPPQVSRLRRYGLLPDTKWGKVKCREDINKYQRERRLRNTLEKLSAEAK